MPGKFKLSKIKVNKMFFFYYYICILLYLLYSTLLYNCPAGHSVNFSNLKKKRYVIESKRKVFTVLQGGSHR